MITMVRVTFVRVSPFSQGCCRSKAGQRQFTAANSEHGVSGHCVRADRHATHGTSYPDVCFCISFLRCDWVFVCVFCCSCFWSLICLASAKLKSGTCHNAWLSRLSKPSNYDYLPLTYLVVQIMIFVLTCSAGTSTICSMNRMNDYVLLAIMM